MLVINENPKYQYWVKGELKQTGIGEGTKDLLTSEFSIKDQTFYTDLMSRCDRLKEEILSLKVVKTPFRQNRFETLKILEQKFKVQKATFTLKNIRLLIYEFLPYEDLNKTISILSKSERAQVYRPENGFRDNMLQYIETRFLEKNVNNDQ